MAFVSGQVSVGTAPTVICSPGTNGVSLQNLGAASVFVGGPNVTTGNGFLIPAGSAPVYFPAHGLATIDADDQLYGRVASSTVNVAFIYGP